jgi:20S proteasome alpha/beta subunit
MQIKPLDSRKLVAAAGPQADTVRFVEYIQRNIALHEFRTGACVQRACAHAPRLRAAAARPSHPPSRRRRRRRPQA